MELRTRPVRRDWLSIAVYVVLLASLSAVEAAAYGIDVLRRCYLKTGTELVVLGALCTLPLCAAMIFTRRQEWRWILLAALLIGCNWSVQSSFPPLGPFRSFYWNWQGRLLATAGILGFMAANKSLTFQEIGVTSGLKPRWWLPLSVYVALSAFTWIVFDGCGRPLWDPQTFWFQATMPGLHEELVERGILLALLTRAFGLGQPSALGAFGWPAVLTSINFGLSHIVELSEPIHVTLQWTRLHTAVAGLLFCWIRAGTGSIWPAVVVHNLMNLQAMARYERWT